jgi:hypothetical protein
MRTHIKKITESFQDCNYDIETTVSDWVIYFWNNDIKFFFELPNIKKGAKGILKAKIYTDNQWVNFEDENIDNLIIKIQEIYGEKV